MWNLAQYWKKGSGQQLWEGKRKGERERQRERRDGEREGARVKSIKYQTPQMEH